ncbi:STAS domain-containing protein [Planosporangium mesophilum]|uniref:Anti-sigma factor antagonist n=1 Tax=Planosporangium mesophilum TaxID=689768 RepID=A0A8J3TJA8_9ACTN|nr:STAS domain-containing protein [Planosporangium mesophilum]NJC86710.1 STAS domain-containing protein [Planosporangium mesophilum]GII25664.1 anti-sigma factor antagonist [Planosporangium mesophilum]
MDNAPAAQGRPRLRIAVEKVGPDEVTVSVRGELDLATADQLRSAISALLNRGAVTCIGLDLRGLDFIDSTGIGTLVVAQRICQQVGVKLRLTAVNAFAARILGVVGVDDSLGLPPAHPDTVDLVGVD